MGRFCRISLGVMFCIKAFDTALSMLRRTAKMPASTPKAISLFLLGVVGVSLFCGNSFKDALNNSFPGVLRLGYFSDGANLS